MFELTRDAFVLIVMGFTGTKALQRKIRDIKAFSAM
ncbi:Rha family transcriptional regulator [Enterobacter ludwigii]